jgi:hypothetical protein
MKALNLITKENNVAVSQILVIVKQDAALNTAIQSLNELSHINRIEFEDYGQKYGISPELLQEIRVLQEKLNKAKYGRF